ncbi:MAG TPA: DUF4279 domain-containing protein [Acidobacteriaceae bacterium]|nr:DUF4279 domain-containing protein [Acidobacteriaceae bacterium]
MAKHVGHFSLWGDFEAAKVTTALDLEPSCVYPKGTVFDGANGPTLVTTWDFYCPPEKTMNEQVTFLLDSLWPRADVLRTLTVEFKAEMNLAGSCEDGSEVLNLDSETLQRLVSLNMTLNCFYFKEEEDGD